MLCSKVLFWFRLDHLLHDIGPQEEAIPLTYMPCRTINISDWNDATCDYLTSFNNSELCEIYGLFDINSRADDDGYIRISKSVWDTVPIYFPSRRIILISHDMMQKGWPIKDMCNQVFGGDYSRCSYGWKWILFYIDRRYRNVLGHQGLLRSRDRFPEFFQSIQQRVCQSKRHFDDHGNMWESSGLAFLPYRIFVFHSLDLMVI